MSNSTASRMARAHRQATEIDIAQVTRLLADVFGPSLVAKMAGITDPKQVRRWASGENRPRIEAEQRLRAAMQVYQLLQVEESPHTVRAWFIGLNPQLDDNETPVEAIAAGRIKDVLAAADAYLAGG